MSDPQNSDQSTEQASPVTVEDIIPENGKLGPGWRTKARVHIQGLLNRVQTLAVSNQSLVTQLERFQAQQPIKDALVHYQTSISKLAAVIVAETGRLVESVTPVVGADRVVVIHYDFSGGVAMQYQLNFRETCGLSVRYNGEEQKFNVKRGGELTKRQIDTIKTFLAEEPPVAKPNVTSKPLEPFFIANCGDPLCPEHGIVTLLLRKRRLNSPPGTPLGALSKRPLGLDDYDYGPSNWQQ